jgi:choline kinase
MIIIEHTEGSVVNIDNFSVLILSAGYGKRMGPFSRMVNKGLIPYKDKALISHIIEKFPKFTKFVIACGHNGQQIKDYVSNVHNDKDIEFVSIPDYSEENTGPATTIQYCAPYLTDNFFWITCDTLFDFSWQNRLDHNWIGVYPVDSKISQDYCWIERDGDNIVKVHNKVHNDSAVDAFIGLMYVKDKTYINNLIAVQAKDTFQGFDGLDLKAHTVHRWLDFGTYEKWQQLTRVLPENSFVKPDEIFYHDNNKVIKYFTNKEHVTSRVNRANANLNCMPSQIKEAGNFLIHNYAPGDIIYNQYTPELFEKMINWCSNKLWKPAPDVYNKEINCKKFYYDKTLERVEQFRIKYSNWSECRVVNNVNVDTIDNYLSKIDWDWLFNTTSWCFVHGDLHFDNTIYNSKTDQFTAIDWRTDFAGQLYGDLYYDLAKLLGGLWLNYRSVKAGKIEYTENSDTATITVPSINNVEVYEKMLQKWTIDNNLDWNKVKTLVPIIYLNMAPLHEPPFDKFLIALAQLHFSKIL